MTVLMDAPPGIDASRPPDGDLLAGMEVTPDAPLGFHTSLKVGGRVRMLATVRDEGELVRALAWAAAERLPFAILGAGSNLLVPDGRTEALVVRLSGRFRDVTVEGGDVRAGAAVRCGALARRLAADGLAGLGFAAGIPGTIGGAVAMNAGYGGRSFADVLRSATLLAPGAAPREVEAADLALGYRTCRVRATGEIVLSARLALAPGDPEKLKAAIGEGDAHRARTQPLASPSCGSVFKNPSGDHAGRLIEAAGCKGLRVGGAEVSSVHANFIVTSPGARAADVLELIERIVSAVRDASGVVLAREVALLSECLRPLP